MNMLKLAKDANPRSDVVHEEIERQMLRILVEDDDTYKSLAVDIGDSDVTEMNETMDELNVIEKVKQVLQSTSGNDTVDMILGSMALNEIVEDPILRQQISNSYAGRPVNDAAIESATDQEDMDFEPHIMIDPETGEQVVAETEQQHLALAAQGWKHEDELE